MPRCFHLSILVVLFGCAAPEPPPPPPPPVSPLPPPPPPAPPVPWTRVPVETAEGFLSFATGLGNERMARVLKLNRLDQAHVRLGDTLLVPTEFRTELEHAPLPSQMPGLDSVPKFLAVSKRIQAFAAYEYGDMVFWGPTSTGRKETPTPPGLYFTNWKARETRSTDNDAWLLKWYVNFHNERGISFHEYDLPGYPASHACVRLLSADAEWLYGWADQWRVTPDGHSVRAHGTPVLVFGEWDFDNPTFPWHTQDRNPAAALVTQEELETVLSPYLTVIRQRVAERDSVLGGGHPRPVLPRP